MLIIILNIKNLLIPLMISPNTVCLKSRFGDAHIVKKNWLVFVSFPLLAIDKSPGLSWDNEGWNSF